MSDLISRSALIEKIVNTPTESSGYNLVYLDGCATRKNEIIDIINEHPTVEPARGEWIYWKEQCEYCMNRNTCSYPENQESMEALKQWEKENKFWGSLKLICDYYVLDKDKYYLDSPPECNAEG